MISLTKYLGQRFTVGGTVSNKILIFDVDDTLIHTTARIQVVKNGKVLKTISNNEYNTYQLKPGEEFSYGEFEDYNILKKEAFTPYWNTLKREYSKGTHISILTARSNTGMIRKFFLYHGIDIKPELVFAISDPKIGLTGTVQERKAEVIKILSDIGYKTFVFFDDNEDNLSTAKQLERKYPIKIITVKA